MDPFRKLQETIARYQRLREAVADALTKDNPETALNELRDIYYNLYPHLKPGDQ